MVHTRSESKNKTKAPNAGITKISAEGAKEKLKRMEQMLKQADNMYNEGGEEMKRKIAEQENLVATQKKIVDQIEFDDSKQKIEVKQVDEGDMVAEMELDDSEQKPEVKEEDKESMFVEDNTKSHNYGGRSASVKNLKEFQPVAEGHNGDPDDVGLACILHHLSLEEETGEFEGFFRGPFGIKYGIQKHGPKGAAKYTIAPSRDLHESITSDPAMDLDLDPYGERRFNGKKVAKKGQVYAIQGVAWESLDDHDRMSSLSPRNWPKETNGPRRRTPPLRIKVKWVNKEGPISWEKRANVKRYWPRNDGRGGKGTNMRVPEPVKFDEITILEEGEEISKADFVIIDTAVRCEERYREYSQGLREDMDRSPTPGFPLLSEQEKTGGSQEPHN